MQPESDILIVGGGPAAMTAALYSLRSGRSVKMIEKENFGGQIADSPRVENFPSLKSISGLEFSSNLFDQVTSIGAEFELDEIQSIGTNADGFEAIGKSGNYAARSIILATGVKHRRLNIEGEDRYLGHGVSYCAVCDGPFYAGKSVMVIGDANTALQYAILLAAQCPHVDVVTLFDKFFADEVLIKGLKSLQNVTITQNMSSLSFNGDGKKLASVSFLNTLTKEKKDFPTAAAFVAIGQLPDNERFAPLVELKKGFIVTDESMATKTPGIFACGDCRDKKIRQLTTACGDGAIAALSASTYVFNQLHK
ncbi:MAG: FAD-dependent oxidoreductase [Bacilli bacterium]